MTLAEFREEMLKYRDSAAIEAIDLKESNLAWTWLCGLYDRFDSGEKSMADQVLAEWLESDQASLRLDAEVIIRRRRVVSALPAIRRLATRLSRVDSPSPMERDELERVEKLTSILTN